MKNATLEKLSALACHPSTGEHERDAAACAFFKIHQKAGTSPMDAQQAVSGASDFTTWQWRPPAPQRDPKDESNVIGFGKYSGRTVRWIVANDTKYVKWLLEKAKNISQPIRDVFNEEIAAAAGRKSK